MRHIERPTYLDWLKSWREKQIIKVISGVRRCGKSTILEMYRNFLLDNGVAKNQIITINFEDIDYESLNNYQALYGFVKGLLIPTKMNYIFLDEIQHCTDFEKAVDSLFIKSNCDVYITGSNSYFMSSDLSTLLSGRYVELKMLPLSFKEFSSALHETQGHLTRNQAFNLYTEFGSFPFILGLDRFGQETKDYLDALYSTIILNDVVKRCRISDVSSLESVTKYMLHNIGNRTSSPKIANTLKSAGKSIDQKTVDKYLNGLTEALLLYKAQRYNLKGKQYLTTLSKYYAVDMGIRSRLVSGKESDAGHILENIIFLELNRRGYEVFVGEMDTTEVDFVAIRNRSPEYYQVASTALDGQTLNRELAPLRKITDNFPKYLLTLDEAFADANFDGIIKMNALDWLLQ